jgi:hypothetical protein
MVYVVVKEFKGSVVGGLDPPGNSILGKAVEGVRATNPLLVGVNDSIEAPLKLFRAATVMERSLVTIPVLLQSER